MLRDCSLFMPKGVGGRWFSSNLGKADRDLRFSRKDPTFEVNTLFINMAFCFFRPVNSSWALQEKKCPRLAKQSSRYMISTANTSHTLINTHDVNRLDTSCQSHVDVMNKDISLLWKNELTSRVRIFCQKGIEKQPSDRKKDYYKG